MIADADDPTKDFAADPRISFDKAKQNWVLEDDNGNELEWDARSRRFISLVGAFDWIEHALTLHRLGWMT